MHGYLCVFELLWSRDTPLGRPTVSLFAVDVVSHHLRYHCATIHAEVKLKLNCLQWILGGFTGSHILLSYVFLFTLPSAEAW